MFQLLPADWVSAVQLAYSVGFWAVLGWVFNDARKRKKSRPLLVALGAAVVFPVGLFVYRWMRGRERPANSRTASSR